MRDFYVFSAAGIVKLQAVSVEEKASGDGTDVHFELRGLAGEIVGFFALSKISGWVWGDAMPKASGAP
jgi:hypothetical protein